MLRSLLNKQQSQQIWDINRGARRLEARHKIKGQAAGEEERSRNELLFPNANFFIIEGGWTQTALVEANAVARQNQIDEPTFFLRLLFLLPVTVVWSGTFDGMFYRIWFRWWKEEWNIWQLSNAGHNTGAGDYSSATRSSAKQNALNTSYSQVENVDMCFVVLHSRCYLN